MLAEQRLGERRQEAPQRARLGQPGAERIGQRDVALAHGLHEAGDAELRARVELERIGELAVDAAQQDAFTRRSPATVRR